ncbi:MAG: S8 family serine peptidase, partial [Rhizobiales bacterium]|nr:S8 family serine peptidase [Hyphomicrobiales bacterium]
MIRTLFRTLLSLALALTFWPQGALAQGPCPSQTACPPPNSQPYRPDSNNNTVWYVVGGIATAAIGAFIASRLFPTPERGLPPQQPSNNLPSDPPPIQPINLPPPGAGAPGAGGSGGKGTPKAPTTALRKGFNLPPPGETRFVANEVMLDIPSRVSERQLDLIAARHRMVRVETQTFRLTGRTLHRWTFDDGNVRDMIRGMVRERQVAGAQPNYLYALAQDPLPAMNADQYAPERLNLPEAHKLATGSRVLVAVIDSGIDASHPDLSGAIVSSFEAAAGNGASHPHGTGMAGAIAARHTTLGAAPRVGVLAVRAFDPRTTNGEGTTFNIIKGLEWAAENGARVINMSF